MYVTFLMIRQQLFFFIGYCLNKPGKCVSKCLEWKSWMRSIKGGCWEQESKIWVCCTITLNQWAWLCKSNIFLEECSLPNLNKQMENPERCIFSRHEIPNYSSLMWALNQIIAWEWRDILMCEQHGCLLPGSEEGDINSFTKCTVSGDQALITYMNSTIVK